MELPKYMTQDQVRLFFQEIESPRDRALFGMIYHYGLRVSEAGGLRLRDIDTKRDKLFVRRSKGSVSGEKPLWLHTKKLLKKYLRARLARGDWLFTGKKGPLSRRHILRLFRQYAQDANLPDRFTVHSLRHSIAVHILDAGEPLEYVKDHLGHKYLKNTQVYAQISSPNRRQTMRRLEYHSDIVRA